MGFSTIADKVPSVTDTATLAEAFTEGKVGVIDTSIEDARLDALARVLERLVDIVHTCHSMWAIQLLSGRGFVLCNLGLAYRNNLDGPDTLDAWDLGQVLAFQRGG